MCILKYSAFSEYVQTKSTEEFVCVSDSAAETLSLKPSSALSLHIKINLQYLTVTIVI